MHQGIDTNTMLPYLSRYLGHKSPDETYYYYHLVEKAFDTIREKDSVSGKVIPEVIPYEMCIRDRSGTAVRMVAA